MSLPDLREMADELASEREELQKLKRKETRQYNKLQKVLINKEDLNLADLNKIRNQSKKHLKKIHVLELRLLQNKFTAWEIVIEIE